LLVRKDKKAVEEKIGISIENDIPKSIKELLKEENPSKEE
jgi:hypothetical protein